jgi:SAM-dependent methyltransferase
MRNHYPLFQSHLDLAHHYWSKLLLPGDIAVDATCGNGQDTLKLASLILTAEKGQLYACDIQKNAVEATRLYLEQQLDSSLLMKVRFILGCHSTFPSEIEPQTVKLFVYNLGYLPGGNKNLTTSTQTTLQSIQHAQILLKAGGMICLTCYPGHAEGAKEEKAILNFAASLSPYEWSVCHHQWLNRQKAPSLLLLQKALPFN